MASAQVLPPTDVPETSPFLAAYREGVLAVEACDDCGALRWPPRPCCPVCRSFARRVQPIAGEGRLWSWTVAHPPTLPAFTPYVPFVAALVELADAPHVRVAGNLVAEPGAAINSVDPASLRVGMPLTVWFEKLTEEVTLPRWTPARKMGR